MALIYKKVDDKIKYKIRVENLLKIKRIVDLDINGDKLIIVRRKKNIEFMRMYDITVEEIKNIIRALSVEDCFSGPERDRDTQYTGWIFKFSTYYENIKLYIKIRVEKTEKVVCISIHEFGKI